MNPTLLEDILYVTMQRYMGLGMALEPALDRAARDILRRNAPGRSPMGPAESFCFRALLRGACNRLKRTATPCSSA